MTPEEYGQQLAKKDREINLLRDAIDKSNEALEGAVDTKGERDRFKGALEVIHAYATHELGSLTGKMCKLTCPVCVARKALGLPEPEQVQPTFSNECICKNGFGMNLSCPAHKQK